MRAWIAAGFSLALFGCSSVPAGEAASGFVNAQVAAAYIPLEGRKDLILTGRGAAVAIAPGIAATNAHNANLIDASTLIGTSANYDLLFFRTRGATVPPLAAPKPNESVIAYGQGKDGALRQARGVVSILAVALPAPCQGCETPYAFAFRADGGEGFSGGPVVDAEDGSVLGIVFGFRDEPQNGRVMYAYDMSHVMAELARLKHPQSRS